MGKKGNGCISKLKSGNYEVDFYLNYKHMRLGNYKTKELAEEARKYFVKECNYDLNKFKSSKYWLELRSLGCRSKEYVSKGSIIKREDNHYVFTYKHKHLGFFRTSVEAEEARRYFIEECNYDLDKYYTKYNKRSKRTFSNGNIQKRVNNYFAKIFVNGKYYLLGSFKTKELANKAIKIFKNLNCNYEEYKKSPYWTEIRLKNQKSEGYISQGTIYKDTTGYRLYFKPHVLGTFKTRELAEEVRQYFISIGYNYEEYLNSKYINLKNIFEKTLIEKRQKNVCCYAVKYYKKTDLYRVSLRRENAQLAKYFHSKDNAMELNKYACELLTSYQKGEINVKTLKTRFNSYAKKLKANELEKIAKKLFKERKK